MCKKLLLALLAFALPCWASGPPKMDLSIFIAGLNGQINPLPRAIILTDSSGVPFPSGSGSPITPVPEAVMCYTLVGGSAVPCNFGGAAGSGTVNSGTIGQLTYYGATGTTVSPLPVMSYSSSILHITPSQTLFGVGTLASDWPTGITVAVDNERDTTSVHSATAPFPLGTFAQWNPQSNIASDQNVQAASFGVDYNYDGQSSTSGLSNAVLIYVNNESNTTASQATNGLLVDNQVNGSAGYGSMSSGTFRSLINGAGTGSDLNGVVGQVIMSAGHSDNAIAVVGEITTSGGDIGNVQVFNADTADFPLTGGTIGTWISYEAEDIDMTGRSTSIACAFCASNVIGATQNWGIRITGSERNFLGGPLQALSFQETLSTPASSSAACTAGQFTDDANFHYVCTATNTWKRVALSTF
jgi:hypothetical protein